MLDMWSVHLWKGIKFAPLCIPRFLPSVGCGVVRLTLKVTDVTDVVVDDVDPGVVMSSSGVAAPSVELSSE